MKRIAAIVLFAVLLAGSAGAQNITAEILSGKLIDPEVGVWAWYDLKDNSVEKKFQMRQAIVGKERIRFKTGYWLETQIIPEVGFPAVYKLLLTGPASDPENVHRIIFQEGQRPPTEVEITDENRGEPVKSERNALGQERIALPKGTIMAEHYKIDGVDTEIWINEDVRPMGIVRFKSAQGELKLLRYGKGGPDGESALGASTGQEEEEAEVAPGEAPGGRIQVEVNSEDALDATERNRVNEILERRRRR